ncbi:Serine/threonine-protein kinase [Ceratobasidium sp. AG-Ba]|nr:Serine/threonine-protein kinase [Ceratobasidium sp. AG-Ba]
MTEGFWAYTVQGVTEECTQRAEEALDFIVSHGGTTSRWRSVTITTDAFGPHHAVIDFLASNPLPELRHLQLMLEGPSMFDEFDEAALLDAAEFEPVPFFQDPPAKLNVVKLAGVPNPFLFGHTNQFALPTLTRLDLAFALILPTIEEFATLLKATNQLEVLRLDFSSIELEEDVEYPDQHTPIDLPHLRELALIQVLDSLWSTHLVMMLDAPNVEYLQLDLVDFGEPGDEDDLVGYLVNGGNREAPRPPFPSITRLGVQLREFPRTITKLLKALLLAHPQITRLDVPFMPLDAVNASPRTAPKLNYLQVAGCTGAEVKRVIAARTRAKAPLKVIEFDIHYKDRIRPEEMNFILSKVELRFWDSLNEGRVVSDDETEDEEDEDFESDVSDDLSDASTE